MHDPPADAIVPPPEINHEDRPLVRRRRRSLGFWVRLALVAMALAWVGVFAVAVRLDPYDDGKVWLEGTHQQLGLPPCTFKTLTKLPCPSCGMTSSFALFVRGDLWNAARANVVGAGMALIGLVMVPWCVVSAWRDRWLWVRRIEPVIIRLTVLFLIAMFGRWAIVLLWMWWTGS